VLGCGAGVTAGAIAIAPTVERLTIAEIERLVPAAARAYFGDFNHHVLDDPKVSLRIDDGRHFLQTTTETFDAITTDPFDPWTKGAALLSTREFFDLARRRLNPGGVVTLWVPLYENNTEAVKSSLATFFEVFPHGLIWGNTQNGQGYDLVLVGQAGPTVLDIDALQARLDSPAYAEVRRSLDEVGLSSAVELLSQYAGSGPDLAEWLADAPINRDRNLRLQYLAGLGLNRYQSGPIYADLLRYIRFPEQVFTGSADAVLAVRTGIGKTYRLALQRATREGMQPALVRP
jgi:spermidine synthase